MGSFRGSSSRHGSVEQALWPLGLVSENAAHAVGLVSFALARLASFCQLHARAGAARMLPVRVAAPEAAAGEDRPAALPGLDHRGLPQALQLLAGDVGPLA